MKTNDSSLIWYLPRPAPSGCIYISWPTRESHWHLIRLRTFGILRGLRIWAAWRLTYFLSAAGLTWLASRTFRTCFFMYSSSEQAASSASNRLTSTGSSVSFTLTSMRRTPHGTCLTLSIRKPVLTRTSQNLYLEQTMRSELNANLYRQMFPDHGKYE